MAHCPRGPMADIFLSYDRNDQPQAARLAEALGEGGRTVWWDRTLPPGETFETVIHRELQAAKCVVVLWSAESLRSNWVRDEADIGLSRGVLVPCLIENVQPPLGHRRIQAANLSEWRGDRNDPQFQLLLRGVSNLAPLPNAGSSTHQSATETPRRRFWTARSTVSWPYRVAVIGAIAALLLSIFVSRSAFNVRDYAQLTAPIIRASLPPPPDRGLPTAGIVGTDDREQVADTSVLPWSAICQLFIRKTDGAEYFASGMLLNRTTVLTADHVVFPLHGPAVATIAIVPAARAHEQPFGRFVATSWRRIAVTNDEGFAVIEFSPGTAGAALTPLKLSQEGAERDLISTAGYYHDRPGMWRSSGSLLMVDETKIFYDADTGPGMSGAPVWRSGDVRYEVIGIHMGSQGGGKHALRVTAALLRALAPERAWP